MTSVDSGVLAEIEAWWRCQAFLAQEAELLDDGRLHEWLDLLSEDLEYVVPRRVTRERGSELGEFRDDSFHFRETKETMKSRVERFDKEYAWSENPPSRTRRIVGNVRVEGCWNDRIELRSNFLLSRSQGDTTKTTIIPGERHDVVIEQGGTLKLLRRSVFIDYTIIPTKNISVFF